MAAVCLFVFVTYIPIVMTRNCKGSLRGFPGVSMDMKISLKPSFFCSVDQFCGQILESLTKKCLGTLFTYDKQLTVRFYELNKAAKS